MLHAGIDMHKEFLMVTVLDEEGSEVVSPRRIPTSGLSIEDGARGRPQLVLALLSARRAGHPEQAVPPLQDQGHSKCQDQD